MLKYTELAVTFAEFPDEIAVCLNISNCPCHCTRCSEPWLRHDIGTPLTPEILEAILLSHSDCTLLGLMGGDSDHAEVRRIADFVHAHPGWKVGMYSGLDALDLELAQCLDCYKIGRWIAPEGDVSTWLTQTCGPLAFPCTN